MAKSPWRLATSWKATPVPGPAAGKRTSTRISSGRRDVARYPSNHSAAGMTRSPDWLRTTNSASRARATAGSSAAGSACARLPPIVPRLRIASCPISGNAAASSGTASATVSDSSATYSRVIAPTVTRPSVTDTPDSSPRPLMSMSTAGRASRSAISGIRLCPPARTLASSWCSASRPTASARVAGASYSKSGSFIGTAPQRLMTHAASTLATLHIQDVTWKRGLT